MMFDDLIPLLVAIPLLAGLFSLLVRKRHWQTGLAILSALLLWILVLTLLMSIYSSEMHVPIRYNLAGWGAPLGIDLVVDGLSIIMLLMTSTLALILTLCSSGYFSHADQNARFWPVWWILIAGLNAAFITADTFNVYVALEMIGLSAVALVALAGTKTAYIAALRYALVGLLGSLCYLLGVALLYRAYGTLDFSQLAQVSNADAITWASLSLITVGLLLKTALIPMHFWLPSAHANAPTPVSAVLSALVVKASFYLLIRFWFEVLSPATSQIAMLALGLLGSTAIIWGCIAALRTERLKLIVAYSTVAQLGYLFLLFPLMQPHGEAISLSDVSLSDISLNHASVDNSPLNHAAMIAVIYFMVAHALAKAAMFLAAGSILSVRGHDRVDQLNGLVRTQPIAVFIFAVAGVSLIGLPPSGGFIAKWLMLNVAINNGQWWLVTVMIIGGLLAAAYVGRVLNVAFDLTRRETVAPLDTPSTEINPKARLLGRCGLALALLAVGLGLNTEWLTSLFDTDALEGMIGQQNSEATL